MSDRADNDLAFYTDASGHGGTLSTVNGSTRHRVRQVAEDGALAIAATDQYVLLLSSTTGTKAATFATETSAQDGQIVHITLLARSGGSYTVATDEGTTTLDAAGDYMVLQYSNADTAWHLLLHHDAGAAATAAGALLSANNLSDVASATTSAQNIGALEVANNLSDLASAATARGNLGVVQWIMVTRIDLVGATAAVYRYVHPTGAASATITQIGTAITGALATGDATITAAINATPVTDGAVTITQSGSAAGDIDSATPSAANVIAAGQVLTFTVGGTNTATEFADLTFALTY